MLSFQEDGWGREGEGTSGNNTVLIMFLVFFDKVYTTARDLKCCRYVF